MPASSTTCLHWQHAFAALLLSLALVATAATTSAQERGQGASETSAYLTVAGSRQHQHQPAQAPRSFAYLAVRATLNGKLSGPLLLDTGASFCIISVETARQLGLDPLRGEQVKLRTANGYTEGRLIRLNSIAVGPTKVDGVPAVVLDTVSPPLLGVVGLSFLNHFRYTVDRKRMVLRMERY